MVKLKNIVENRQLYESYPIQYLSRYYDVKNEEEFISLLEEIVYRMHSLNTSVIDEAYDKDLTDVKFFLNELLYELTHKQK